MAKYRGVYKKCRNCVNAKTVLMVLVEVTEECPNKKQFLSGLFVDKVICENCTEFVERGNPPKGD